MGNRFLLVAGVALVAASVLTHPAEAQGTPQVVSAIDVKTLSTGYRSSKIVGSSVVNEKNETVGKVDDLIVPRSQTGLYAVLSVGGVLGVGNKLIAVQYSDLHPSADNKAFVLAGATKDSLTALPAFDYAH